MTANRYRSGWTDDRIETLTKLWADGLSAAQIASKLGGLTRNAVIGKIHRLKLPKRSQDAARAALAYKAPRRAPRVAKPPQVRVIANRHTLDAPPPRPPLVEIPADRFEALPSTTPRHWEDRKSGECSWPIGDEGLNCCAPVRAFGWCAAHVAVGRKPVPTERDTYRSLRKYVA